MVFERYVWILFPHSYAKHWPRYDNLSLEACLSGAQFQRCRVPGCNSGQQCFPDNDSYMICHDCGGRTCIECDIQWHPDVTCADVQGRRAERSGEENAAERYLATSSKLCPKCQIRGQKIVGCDHITCMVSFTLPLRIIANGWPTYVKVHNASMSTAGSV